VYIHTLIASDHDVDVGCSVRCHVVQVVAVAMYNAVAVSVVELDGHTVGEVLKTELGTQLVRSLFVDIFTAQHYVMARNVLPCVHARFLCCITSHNVSKSKANAACSFM